MKAFERLMECVDLLRWIEEICELDDGRNPVLTAIGIKIRAQLDELNLRKCVECGRPYLYVGARHYRCHHCRWKRDLRRQVEREAAE